MAILQYVYGRTKDGWEALYESPELKKLSGLRDRLKAEGRGVTADTRKLKFSLIEGKKTRWVLSHTCPETHDDRGRPGAHVSHSFIGEEADLKALPIHFWDWPGWIKDADIAGDAAAAVSFPASFVDGPQGNSFKERIGQLGSLSVSRLSTLIGLFLEHVALSGAGSKIPQQLTLIGKSTEDIAAWTGLLSCCLPQELAKRHLTFSTSEAGECDHVWLVGRLGESWKGPAGDSPYIIDLTGPEAAAARPKSAWGKFCLEALDVPALGWRAIDLGRHLFAVVREAPLLPRLAECANISHWVFTNKFFTSDATGTQETVLESQVLSDRGQEDPLGPEPHLSRDPR